MATAVDELLDMLFDMIDEAKGTRLNSEKCAKPGSGEDAANNAAVEVEECGTGRT